jgi:hypothetical protein
LQIAAFHFHDWRFRLWFDRISAEVVEESAARNPLTTENAVTLALIFAAAAVGFACWLLYTLATLALPMFAAVSVGMWAHDTGAGPLGSIIAGLAIGVLTLAFGQLSFALLRWPLARLAIGLVFAVPAAVVGYHAVHGIVGTAGIGVETESWRQALGAAGALFIGGAAWMRVASGGETVRRIEQSSRTVG